jgi:hypothetical protein
MIFNEQTTDAYMITYVSCVHTHTLTWAKSGVQQIADTYTHT